MKFDKETIWNIVLIVSIIMIIHGMSNAGDKDKKSAQAAQDETAIGSIGVVASFIGKKAAFPAVLAWPLVTGIVAMFALGPSVFTGWVDSITNLFNPQPGIPIWVWIAGFLVIILMVLKKK